MYTLSFYIDGVFIELFLVELSMLGSLLTRLPKHAEVKIFKNGTQYTNKMLGTSWDQIVENYRHESEKYLK